jgi:hypothetical protein
MMLEGPNEQVTPAGSGAAHEKAIVESKLPTVGPVAMVTVAVPPKAIVAVSGVATGAMKSSPTPDNVTDSGLPFDPL